MTYRYALYGMVVDSDVDLHQDRPAPPGAPTDLVVRREPDGPLAPEPDRAPDRAPALELERGGSRYVAHAEPDGRWRLLFPGACQFVVSADLRRVVVRMVPGIDPGLATVLLVGAVCAFVLYLRGRVVLHASAVEHGGVTVAFTGGSGRGKSTTAALACAAGARLVTDDLLTVDLPDDGTVRAQLGATELRLRKGADTLADRFAGNGAGPGRRTSVDGRQVLRLDDAAVGGLPLAALVVPCPDRGRDDLAAQVLAGPQALFALLAFPRLEGWAHPPVVRAVFEGLSELTRRVPVVTLRIPWGPPFRETLGAEILACVTAAVDAVAAVPTVPTVTAEPAGAGFGGRA